MSEDGARRLRLPFGARQAVQALCWMACVFLTAAPVAVAQPVGDLVISPEFPIAAGVAPADSDTSRPGRAGIGFDGTNFLVVSCRDLGEPAGVFGVIVSPEGVVLTSFHVAEVNPVFGCQGQLPAVSFDGTNYLVVFSRITTFGTTDIVGSRVSPSGMVVDDPAFTILSAVSDTAAVAFDGVRYLVVSAKFSDDTLHDIYGATVSTAAEVSGEFPIFIAPGGQVMASVAFDGANYLVVWSDTRSGSPVGPDADITGTRVTPQVVVLDAAGLPISTATGAQYSPQVTFSGAQYFVVWADSRNDTGSFTPAADIFGTRVAPDGSLLDGAADTGGIAISTAPVPKQHPVTAFDGTNYLVAWEESFFYDPPVGIFGARVSPAGLLIDGPPDTGAKVIGTPSCFACRLVFPSIAAGGSELLLAWVNNTEVAGTSKDVIGVVISPSEEADCNLPPFCTPAERRHPRRPHRGKVTG